MFNNKHTWIQDLRFVGGLGFTIMNVLGGLRGLYNKYVLEIRFLKNVFFKCDILKSKNENFFF